MTYRCFARCLTLPRAVRSAPAYNVPRLLTCVQRSNTCVSRLLSVTGVRRTDRPRLVDMKNGPKSPAVFSDEEIARRLSRLRTYMADNDIGAAVFTSYHNINYFSGFIYCSFGRPYGLIVTQDGCTSVSAGVDGGQPWRRAYGDNVTYTDWQRDNYYHAVRENLKGVKGKVGLEFDNVSLDNLAKFNSALPDTCNGTTDVGEPTRYIRLKKSPDEVSVIRHGARVASVGGDACREAIGAGIPEFEVACASTLAMIREIADIYPNSDLMDTFTWVQSDLNTDGAHNPLTTRKIKSGDILSVGCFPVIQGYLAALERTMFCEHASDEHLRLWELNCSVHRRGLELIKPGAKCSDIALELNEMYRATGTLQYRSFGYGHSFGTFCHYYGREAAVEFREDVDTLLEPGMVVSMEPMIMIPEGMPGAGAYREQDTLIISDTDVENITTFPFGPEKNIIKK